jgi:hypothetical protein
MTSPTRGRDHGGSEAVGQLSEHDEPAPVLNGFPKFVMPRNAIRTASTLQAMSSMRGDLRVRGDVEAWIAQMVDRRRRIPLRPSDGLRTTRRCT